MPIEGQVNDITQLDERYPQSDDPVSQGDNHIRNVKKGIKGTFPNFTGPVTASSSELNQLDGVTLDTLLDDVEQDISNIQADQARQDADISSVSARVSTNTGNISSNQSSIASNSTRINSLEGRTDALEAEDHSVSLAMNDLTDVNTSGVKNGQALVYRDGVWVPTTILGGGSVNFMTQPTTAGDARLNGSQQTYELSNWNKNGTATQTLTVPEGTVFIMEYFFGQASETIRVSLDQIKIDGNRLMTVATSMDWGPTGGSIWPGSEGFTPIVVKESIEVTAYAGANQSTFSIAGMFSKVD